ncbi:MAG TPA: serine/threonine-protein kinase [Candidatus Obscuribacterales bacterium]
MSDPLIGVVLPRRYRVQSLLGRGSMSVVYRGIYEPLEQPVAIKMLKSHLVSDPQQAKRFQQEIKTAGTLNHRNIVSILDFGVTEQGVPYLVMEYLGGRSLADVIEDEDRLSVNRVIKIFSQAASALAFAHQAGVVHRDIKPSNLVIIAEDGDLVKIVDFGIAKLMGPSDSHHGAAQSSLGLTATGEVIGTPLYMSPEQANGRDLDLRSDIYSLGCVMYHAITGRPPFVGDTAIDTIRLQITGTPPAIDKVRPDLYIPERLQSIIIKCLQKDPRLRYQRMEHLKSDLESCDPRRDSLATTVRIARNVVEPTPMPDSLFDDEGTSRLPRVPMLLIMVAALVIVAISAYKSFSDMGNKRHPTPSAASTPSPLRGAPQLGHDASWRRNMVAARTAFEAGQYAQAQILYYDAFTDAEKFDQPDVRRAASLSGLASVLCAEDKTSNAEQAANKALEVYKAASPSNPARAEVYTTLAKIYSQQGDLSNAEDAAKESLDIRKQTLGEQHHDVADSLQCLASVESLRGDNKQADELLTKAIAIAEHSLGNDNPDVASLVQDLALVREKESKQDSAEQLLNTALGIRQKYLGQEHPAVADTLLALGTLEFDVRRDASAETMFKNALAIRQKVFGEQSPRTAEVYSALASFYDSVKRYPDAEEAYRKALNIRQAAWGEDNPKLAPSFQALIKFLQRRHRASEARPLEAQLARMSK